MRITSLAGVLVLAMALPVSAQLGEVRAFESTQIGPLTISFEDVVGDSRCPIDAVCIWEGDGAIQIVVDSARSDPRTFELHTHWDYGSVVEYDDYSIMMVKLLPYPTLAGFPSPEDYVATLLVFGSFVATEQSSWSAVKARF